jgi:hypothetical protein
MAQERRALVAAAILVAATITLTACGDAPDPEPSPLPAIAFVGNTVQFALDRVGVVAWRDVSEEVGVRSPTDPLAPSFAEVLAACYSSPAKKQLNVVAVPTWSSTDDVDRNAHAGDYRALLSDCG